MVMGVAIVKSTVSTETTCRKLHVHMHAHTHTLMHVYIPLPISIDTVYQVCASECYE